MPHGAGTKCAACPGREITRFVNIQFYFMSTQKKLMDDAKMRQSTIDSRKWLNDKNDTIIHVGKNHSIVNDEHKYGESAISKAISNLLKK